MKATVRLAIVLLVLSMPGVAIASSPLETIKTHVNQLLTVLRNQDPVAKSDEAKKKEVIRSISSDLFDFRQLSRFTLGRNWRAFNDNQQKEFVTLYRQLLEGIYMDRLLKYKDEQVVFKRQTSLSENRSEVQTEVVTSGGPIQMTYRMVNEDGQWKVYDVVIENVSLARNYRGQFADILSKNSPDELLKILRKKVEATDASHQ